MPPLSEMSNGAASSDRATVDVLICDDTEALRAVLRLVIGLRPSLRVVGEAGDGDAAIAEATRLQPDVIMLDLAMPRRTGLDALPELRRVAPAAKIIVFSGFSEEIVADDALALGASAFLSKASDIDEINDAIEAVAAQATSDSVVTGGAAPD
jgi:DNA-binding NarL/FixJ family response regulator